MIKNLNRPIAALDVGTAKVCCLIADANRGDDGDDGDLRLKVRGFGHQVSRGVRAGAIVDMDAARNTMLAAIHAAEEMAGETIDEVIVNVSAGHPGSNIFGVEVAIAGHEVSQGDIRRVLDQGRQQVAADDRELIHSIPVGFRIDGSRGIREPRGLYGDRLGVDMHIITAQAGPIRNLATCVAGCHLDIEDFVLSSYASGLSALVEDERELGVTVIDLGAGSTSVAVFAEDELVYTDCLPLGGLHVTSDIAHGLSTPLADAERMKTLYGGAVASPADERGVIDVPRMADDEPGSSNHVSRSLLVGIIRPRIEEIFEMVRDRLAAAGLAQRSGRRIVLTGGASQLDGIGEPAATLLDGQVRLGRPLNLASAADSARGPAFSTCAGLLAYAVKSRAGEFDRFAIQTEGSRGIIRRVGNWFHENF